MAATTPQLGLVTPTQGDLTGTWGNTVNNGITEYTDIAIAGTLTLTGDGAVTLANTLGDASASNITSSLAGAGTVTAQFAIVKVSGTTTTKEVTGPSYSKTYVVDNASSFAVTFKASGQAGVSVAAAEKCTVYYNGTDYVKVASSVVDGVSTFSAGTTGLTPSIATSGAVTLSGTLAVANGGTGITSFGAGVATFLGTPSSANLAAAVTDETGSGALVFATSPTLVTPALGTPASGVVTNLTGTASININGTVGATTPATGAFTDLSFSGTGTVSGGTANGVAYLNGSKVLTTGSALTFDGTRLAVGLAPSSSNNYGAPLLSAASNSFTGSQIESHNDSATNGSYFGLMRSRGTRASPTHCQTGDYIGDISAQPLQDASSGFPYRSSGFVRFEASGNHSTSSLPTDILFGVAGSGSITPSEQMRLTSTGLGIGTSSPAAKLSVLTTGAQLDVSTSASDVTFEGIDRSATSNAVAMRWYARNGDFIWNNGSYSEAMRLTSTGLGIGTSSPTVKLDVLGGARLTNSNGSGFLTIGTASGADQYQYITFGGGNGGIDYGWQIGRSSNTSGVGGDGAFYFYDIRANATRMSISNSGNLGLGVTPSAWGSSFKAAQVGTGSLYAAAGNNTNFASNIYHTGALVRYIESGNATQYSQIGGQHQWYTAPSGTAGNAISFTQAMTLTQGGLLGIGVTSPTTVIDAQDATGASRITLTNTANAAAGSGINFIVKNGATTVGNATIRIDNSDSLAFFNLGGERARITSGGDLLVGTTSNSRGARLRVEGIETAYFTGYGNGYGIGLWMTPNPSATGGTATPVSFQNVSDATVGSISTTASATAYNTSSDYRLKNITGPITTSGAYIDSLNPVEGTWKADGSTFVGLIAHEVQEASRTPVATGVKDGEQMQGMDYSSAEIIANLIAEVKSLRQRLAAAGI